MALPAVKDLFGTIQVIQPSGIAGLASKGAQVDERNRIRYFDLEARSLLNRASSHTPLPFVWTINPYRGCEVGCVYCYARYTHEFMGFDDPLDFERRIYIKKRAAEVLERDLAHGISAEEPIAIGTATDPYQPAERRYGITRSILEVFAHKSGLSLSVTTKQELILRDLDLLAAISKRNRLSVNITITTPDHRKARVLEPRASTPQARFRVIERLSRAGLRANINIMPIIPGITDDAAELEELFNHAKRAGVAGVGTNVLFLRPSAVRRFYPFLGEHYPRLLKSYRRAYGRNHLAPEFYRKRINDLLGELRAKYGLEERGEYGECEHGANEKTRAPDLFSMGRDLGSSIDLAGFQNLRGLPSNA